jgi:uncharacterized SAM-binding protein YcdF (DUF218 family)
MKQTRSKPSSDRRKATRKHIFLGAVVLFLPACLLAGWLAAKILIVKVEVPAPDAIVVLSGSATYIERTAWAAQLYREGRASVVLVTNDGLLSGWDTREQRNPYYYELATRKLEQQGVPPQQIEVVSDRAAGTYEESLAVREFAVSHKLKRLLIVTSAYHSRRALWSMQRACEGTGIQIGIDSPPPGQQTPSPWIWWAHRWGWKVVGGEYVKMIYYWTKY